VGGKSDSGQGLVSVSFMATFMATLTTFQRQLTNLQFSSVSGVGKGKCRLCFFFHHISGGFLLAGSSSCFHW
jgi:hypothetical protein